MRIGVFFGSFNPIHEGHTAIVKRFIQEDLDEIWISVSPQNPLKSKNDLLDAEIRVKMVKLATQNIDGVKVTDFEKNLPQPSYTYEALLFLKGKYPDNDFVLLMGGDNCSLFKKWRNSDKILDTFDVFAYPRSKDDIDADLAQRVKIIEAPLLEYASTTIRKDIQERKKPEGLSLEVEKYIEENALYRL